MSAVRPSLLVDAILDAVRQSGGVGTYLSVKDQVHPRVFGIEYLEASSSVWVYIWTLTPGGRTSLPNEYRIQITSVSSPLQVNPHGYTVLLGYHPGLRMFAGFDIKQHGTFTPGSPSVQINIETLHAGLQNGLAFGTKGHQEIVLAIRPDQLLNYVINATQLHRYADDAVMVNLLERATEMGQVDEHMIAKLTIPRRAMVIKVSRYAREANFRQQVLNAYEQRCAVTRAQLKLVDAAHILPVPVPGSSDHVTNGIALSPTIHRAYDNGIIFLDEKYVMRLNEEKARQLVGENLHGGLVGMRTLLGMRVHLPADRRQWPNKDLIRSANRYRRISGY